MHAINQNFADSTAPLTLGQNIGRGLAIMADSAAHIHILLILDIGAMCEATKHTINTAKL